VPRCGCKLPGGGLGLLRTGSTAATTYASTYALNDAGTATTATTTHASTYADPGSDTTRPSNVHDQRMRVLAVLDCHFRWLRRLLLQPGQ
jgi:hypothetical protein